jgi:hypothetical protein
LKDGNGVRKTKHEPHTLSQLTVTRKVRDGFMTTQSKYTYDFPRPRVSCDMVVFAQVHGERHVLLIRRGNEPFKGIGRCLVALLKKAKRWMLALTANCSKKPASAACGCGSSGRGAIPDGTPAVGLLASLTGAKSKACFRKRVAATMPRTLNGNRSTGCPHSRLTTPTWWHKRFA